uniref:Uncharacterized protein n=1 Tax=Arundo donax TaxID=35708 RepID=A0A0A8YA30_ARUDO
MNSTGMIKQLLLMLP